MPDSEEVHRQLAQRRAVIGAQFPASKLDDRGKSAFVEESFGVSVEEAVSSGHDASSNADAAEQYVVISVFRNNA